MTDIGSTGNGASGERGARDELNFDYGGNGSSVGKFSIDGSSVRIRKGGQNEVLDAHLPNPERPKIKQSHEGEHRGDHGDSPLVVITRSTCIFSLCAALNSCNLGYDIGVNTDAAKILQDSMGLTNIQLEVFMGSLNLFAIIGGISAHLVSDRFGRRGAFIVAAVGFIIGVIIQATSQTYGVLMFGRVFVGLGVGFGLAIDPIYISELSPARYRGQLVTWSEIATNVGVVFGFLSGAVFYDLDPDDAWRAMFGVGVFLPVVMIFLTIFVMPESPRWLVAKGREDEAKLVLEKVYPSGYDVEVIVKDIRESIQRELAAERATGWDVILFPTPAYRRMLLVGFMSAISQQLVGIDAIQYFMVFIINESGVTERGPQTTILICLGLIKLACIVVAGSLFDKKGRKPLFFVSLIGMAVALLVLAISFLGKDQSAVAVAALAFYLAFFSLGMGPGAWLIPSEVFSTTIRAKAMSIATFLNRVGATIMSSTFLSLADMLTWTGYFLVMFVMCVLFVIFFYIYLPETKGRSLEDMAMYFAEITGDRSIIEAEGMLEKKEVEQNNDDNGNKFTDVVDEESDVVGTMA